MHYRQRVNVGEVDGQTMTTLRQLRREHHLTQEQLATAADVSPSTVYHIEAGKVRPRPSIVRRLARALNVDPQSIDAGVGTEIVI
jgi:DNA-binding XRE family transcriptional regulator